MSNKPEEPDWDELYTELEEVNKEGINDSPLAAIYNLNVLREHNAELRRELEQAREELEREKKRRRELQQARRIEKEE